MTLMSQNEKVLHRMRDRGFVSRNWALKNFITRLAARIHDLRKRGYEIVPITGRGNDYMYHLVSK